MPNDDTPSPEPITTTVYTTTLTPDDLRALIAQLLPDLIAQIVRDNGGIVPGTKA